jgi:hypothetical protein
MGGRKKRCSICGRWFYPNARTRHCQKTCGRAECREAQQVRTQARWRKSNPDYWVARRIAAKTAALEQDGGESRVEASLAQRPPAVMAEVPWDVVQKAFGIQGAVILSILVRLALRGAQKALGSQPTESTAEYRRLGSDLTQKAIEGEAASIQAHTVPPTTT